MKLRASSRFRILADRAVDRRRKTPELNEIQLGPPCIGGSTYNSRSYDTIQSDGHCTAIFTPLIGFH